MTTPQQPEPPGRRTPRPKSAPSMGRYVEWLMDAVADLAVLVRDVSPVEVAEHVRAVLAAPAPDGVDPVVGLVVGLAAAVPVDQTLGELYGWTLERDPTLKLRAALTEYRRLCRLGQPVPDRVRQLARQYEAYRAADRRRARCPATSLDQQVRDGHATHKRLRAAGEPIPDDVQDLERQYQTACKARRAQRRADVAPGGREVA
jgi:hypothetical protein